MKSKMWMAALLAAGFCVFSQESQAQRRQRMRAPEVETMPGKVVSGPQLDEEEGVAMLMDGRKSTKWCYDMAREMPYEVVIQTDGKSDLTAYGLVTGDDTHSYPGRNPRDWQVWGSDDQKDWTLVDERKFDSRMRDENEREYRYFLRQPRMFKYYKFRFLRMSEGTRIQLAEMVLYKRK